MACDEANHWRHMPYWSTLFQDRACGRSTVATADKGEKFLEAAVRGLAQMVRDLRELEINPRVDHH